MPAYYARCVYRSNENATGDLVVNVLHVEVDQLAGPFNPTATVNDVDTWLTTLYKAMLYNNTKLHDLTVTLEDYALPDTGQAVKSIEAFGTRTTSDQKLDPAVCALLAWRTAVPKRYARGHTFAPPAISSTTISSLTNLATSGNYWDALQAFGTAYVAGHTSGSTSYKPIIYSRSQQLKSATPFIFDVTNFTVRPTTSLLRKRRTAP